MDLKLIRRVVELMKTNELTAFEVEEEGFKLNLRRESGRPPQWVEAPPTYVAAPSAAPVAAAAAVPAAPPADETVIAAPMVGTFYSSSSPETEAFVKVGDEVEYDSTVCIIEAMKVMNELKAELKGKILELLVENATPVEYGQPLFRVRQT